MLVSGFLAAIGLAPSLTPTAPAPAPAPFAWALLGFVRREIEQQVAQIQRTFFNRTPIAAADDVAVSDGDPTTTIRPLANDRDPDRGDVLKVVSVTPPANADGTLTIDANGTTLTYTPGSEAEALGEGQTLTETFSYTVSDVGSAPHVHGLFGLLTGAGHAASATITITVTGVNDGPTAVNDTVATAIGEDGPPRVINVLDNDVDPDTGDIKTVVAVTDGVKYGRVTINADNTVTYTPDDRADALAAGITDTDTFTYIVSDRAGAQSAATVTVTIAGANDAPAVVGAEPQTISELDDGVEVGTVEDPDAGDRFTVTRDASGTPRGTVAIVGNAVTYTPSAETRDALGTGQSAVDTFTYTITDASGATSTATVSVTIKGVSDAGVISTGDKAPVEVEFGTDPDFGLIRNEDGTLTPVRWDEEDEEWQVDAAWDLDFDSGEVALDGRYAYADVQSENPEDDGTLAVVDLETGTEVGRVVDVRTGLAYRFGEVTDVAVDTRTEAGQAEARQVVRRAYVLDSSGTVVAVDPDTLTVVGRQETGVLRAREATTVTADATAVSASPRLAVAKGGDTIYVANGNRISVVKRQTAVAARAAAGEVNELTYDESMDLSLEAGEEVTALETSEDGLRLYATIASTDANGRAVTRLEAIDVDQETGTLSRGASVEVGSRAGSIAVNDDFDRGYVVSAEDRTMSVVDLRRMQVLDVVQTGVAAGVAVVPRTNTVLVTNPNINAISVVKDTAVVSPDGPVTITLDWGSVPRDLDAHLVAALADETSFHVFYANPTWQVGTQVGAALDVDDVNGDGPEVIALNTMSPGTYLFYVDRFSNDAPLAASATTVVIQDQSTGQKVAQFDVPAQGTGRYWAVFNVDIDDSGNVTIIPRTDGISEEVPPLDPPLTGNPTNEISEAATLNARSARDATLAV